MPVSADAGPAADQPGGESESDGRAPGGGEVNAADFHGRTICALGMKWRTTSIKLVDLLSFFSAKNLARSGANSESS